MFPIDRSALPCVSDSNMALYNWSSSRFSTKASAWCVSSLARVAASSLLCLCFSSDSTSFSRTVLKSIFKTSANNTNLCCSTFHKFFYMSVSCAQAIGLADNAKCSCCLWWCTCKSVDLRSEIVNLPAFLPWHIMELSVLLWFIIHTLFADWKHTLIKSSYRCGEQK